MSTAASGKGREAAPELALARQALRAEAKAVLDLARRVDGNFAELARRIRSGAGRVYASGIGKSGIAARKIAATLTAVGVSAHFLHATDALHGEMGVVSASDILLLVSKSGANPELILLAERVRERGAEVAALTGDLESPLARRARWALDCGVQREACPLNVVPTSSTLAAIAMGDALALAAGVGNSRRAFTERHPGGALGARMRLRVSDAMLPDCPRVSARARVRELLALLGLQRGTAAIVDEAERVLGVATLGDLSRAMQRDEALMDAPVSRVMNSNPELAEPELDAAEALARMKRKGIMAMPVVRRGRLVGIIHLHDLLRAGASA